MKHYKDSNNKLYGFDSEQSVPAGLIEITKTEAERIGKINYEKEREEQIAQMDYVRQRLMSYPELGEFVDAWVKNDNEALEEYRQKCLSVKTKYPKPEGF
jgi:hypothetical protein